MKFFYFFRYGVSSRAAAALTTAAWIDAGLISEENTQFIVDHQKIVRAQAKVMIELKMNAPVKK